MKFRKAIGAIVLDKNNNIIAFQRRDFPDSWQSPEGGIDEGETPKEALFRELKEEINLKKNEYEIIKETKEPIRYFFNENDKVRLGFDGQEKKFYLIKLNTDKTFKFDNTDEIEFISSKIMEAKELLEKVPIFKKEMYKKIIEEFKLFLKNPLDF